MDHINLVDTQVADQYKGAGNAFLVMENGEPTQLIYENPECPPVAVRLSEDELFDLFGKHGIDFYELEQKQALILMGTCSCYQFAFPEVFIDFAGDTQ